jgi:hypothetical protein
MKIPLLLVAGASRSGVRAAQVLLFVSNNSVKYIILPFNIICTEIHVFD